MVLFPNAKINLGLQVTQKRSDGFHNIETIFYPVPLCDALELVVAGDKKFEFSSSGIEIPGNKEDNLCIKAWRMLEKDFSLPPVKIHLHKTVPIGAGLGGGSSDGAFMIKLISRVFSLELSTGTMEEYARQLGSDCPFFIQNQPVFAYGKGDQFEKLSLDLSGYLMIIVKPDVYISTMDAYAAIKPSTAEVQLPVVISNSIHQWRHHLSNDFEQPVFEKFPSIQHIKSQFYNYGAIYAQMSGSGSAVYGIFEKETNLKKHFQSFFYWQGRLSGNTDE
ncbi:MAG: 4-(cytidine 5'-diphospho)-2-C-methyl-D-erythritol kinase [Bacteroidales bacterium]|nr:4-(cytidine 5'-diphospho)-2-C-methyl-D-erythritol kinase [Bacteroidales bacterium]